MPYDPVANRAEAKKIIEIYDQEIFGKYDGTLLIVLDTLARIDT